MRDRIPIKKDLIPYGFDIVFGTQKFNLKFMYNSVSDLFTVRLKQNNKVLCYEPLIYGVQLFKDVYVSGTFPMVIIEPLDESGGETEITWDNFGDTVFLTLDNGKG